MRIEELKPGAGCRRRKKRVGRGPGSGLGKTAGKGHKGQKARSGGGVKPGFEGGQMPMQRRLPKRGFTNIFGKEYAIINLADIEKLGLEEVSPESLSESGRVKLGKNGLKVLGMGELSRAVKVRAHAISASAREKIEKAGGSVEVVGA